MQKIVRTCILLTSFDKSLLDRLPIQFQSITFRLVFGALLAVFSMILQSLGAYGGIGYAFSMMSTIPIFLSVMLSVEMGMLSYFVSILLLFFFQPSELVVFPFTTGILGLSLGITLRYIGKTLVVSLMSSVVMTVGILFVVEILQFPLLGPDVSGLWDMKLIGAIVVGGAIYSWIMLKLCVLFLKLLFRSVSNT